MIRSARTVVIAAALVTAGVADRTSGEERLHTVDPGESVSAIAQRYYGDFEHARLLLRYNGRADARIHPGESLRVPTSESHRVRAGDTGSRLAARFVGRASAWPAVAELNGVSPSAPLRVGQVLVMPVVLTHRLARGESLAGLAARHYGDPARAALLQEFNRIAAPRDLAVGQAVEIPLLAPALVESAPATHAEPPAPVAATTSDTAPAPAVVAEDEGAGEPAEPTPAAGPPAESATATPEWFVQGIDEAESSYRRGEFGEARDRIAELTQRIGTLPSPDDRARLWRLAAFVHVAYDRTDDACAAFDSARRERGALDLDPDLVSPKIRDSLAACPTDSVH